MTEQDLLWPKLREICHLHNSTGNDHKVKSRSRIGELLTELKAELPPSEWLPWIKANLPFSERIAEQYMQVFQNPGWIEARRRVEAERKERRWNS